MKIVNRLIAVALIFSIIIVQGCATVLQPGPDMIPVNSRPDGAAVFLDTHPVGKTPVTVSVPRSSDCIIQIEKEGYKKVIIDQDKKLAGWFIPGNLLWLLVWPAFPVAMVVDLATYNQGKYSTVPINVELIPEYQFGREVSDSPAEEVDFEVIDVSETGDDKSEEPEVINDEISESRTELEKLVLEEEKLKRKIAIKKLEAELGGDQKETVESSQEPLQAEEKAIEESSQEPLQAEEKVIEESSQEPLQAEEKVITEQSLEPSKADPPSSDLQKPSYESSESLSTSAQTVYERNQKDLEHIERVTGNRMTHAEYEQFKQDHPSAYEQIRWERDQGLDK